MALAKLRYRQFYIALSTDNLSYVWLQIVLYRFRLWLTLATDMLIQAQVQIATAKIGYRQAYKGLGTDSFGEDQLQIGLYRFRYRQLRLRLATDMLIQAQVQIASAKNGCRQAYIGLGTDILRKALTTAILRSVWYLVLNLLGWITTENVKTGIHLTQQF